MKKFTYLVGMLLLAFVFGFGLTGCFTFPVQMPSYVSAGEALDAIGSARAAELQYYAGKSIILTLMRSKNGQLDSGAVIKNGQATYTRENISIPYGTAGVLVQRRTLEDGQLVLGIAFEEDESKLLWFAQTTTELAPFTHFVLLPDGSSAEGIPIVKYGNAYYWVQYGSDAILAITENLKAHTQNPGGRKLK
jgi:hypothetical protein